MLSSLVQDNGVNRWMWMGLALALALASFWIDVSAICVCRRHLHSTESILHGWKSEEENKSSPLVRLDVEFKLVSLETQVVE